MSKPSVYIGGCVGRTVEPLHAQALVPLLRDPAYGYFPQVGDALVERARAMSATNFLLNTKGDIHLSLDSDIVQFTKEDIDRMCEQAVEFGIVGAVYVCRAVARTFPASFFGDQSIEFNRDDTPVPIKWIATGCVAVHRRVFEKMAETLPLLHKLDGPRAFYPFYQSMIYDAGGDQGEILLSEDYAFSERAAALGFPSYINPAIRIGHMGPYVYRLEDMAAQILKPQPLTITQVDRYWRIEYSGEVESPESMGRIPEGKGEEIKALFEKPNRAERRRKVKA